MLPRNTCKEFLSHSRQIFLISRQRPFPEPAKTAAAKLSSLFLCKLLNRFRFSPQIVISLPETPQNTRHPPPSYFSGGCLIQQIICIYVCIYRVMPSGLPSSLRGGRLPALQCKDDADGVCHCGVVDGCAFCGLAVQQAAQAFGSQNEVGGRDRAHEGSGHSGDQ